MCNKCVTNPGIKNLLYLIERVEFSIEVQFNKLKYKNNTLFIYKIINLVYQENTPTLTSIFYLSNFGLNSPLHRDFQS